MPPDHERRSETFTNKILKFWPILFAIGTFIVMQTRVNDKLDNHESRIAKLENTMDRVASNTDRLVDKLLDKN